MLGNSLYAFYHGCASAAISSGKVHLVCDLRHIFLFSQPVVSPYSRQAAGLDSETRLAHVVVILEIVCRCAAYFTGLSAAAGRAALKVAVACNPAGVRTSPACASVDPQRGLHLCGYGEVNRSS